jgi:protein arginine N-methyltransferase 7
MSTEPEATRDNFARDMQWGQALQLVEDTSAGNGIPQPVWLEAGEEVDLVVRFSEDSAVVQFAIEKLHYVGAWRAAGMTERDADGFLGRMGEGSRGVWGGAILRLLKLFPAGVQAA